MVRTGSMPSSRSAASWRAAALLVLGAQMATGCGYLQARVEMKKGNQYYNTKKYDEAVESYRKVIEFNPEYRDAYQNLGLSYLALYQPGSTHEKDIAYAQGAIKAFTDYLKLDPENEKVKNYLVEICQKANAHEEAIRFFEEEHRRHPDDIKTIQLIGNLLSKIGNIDEALKWMQMRIDLEPDNHEAYYTIGVNCWARSYSKMDLSIEERYGVLDRGLAALDKAIALKPDYFEAYTYKNLVLREKAKVDPSPQQRLIFAQEADQFLKKAMEIQNAQRQAAAQAEGKAGGQ